MTAFPALYDTALPATCDALHRYGRVLGRWITTSRVPRKHWWQGSLRPSLRGVTSGVIYAGLHFELELNLIDSQLHARTTGGDELLRSLHGQAAEAVDQEIQEFLVGRGLDDRFVPKDDVAAEQGESSAYSAECAQHVAGAWSSVTSAMEDLRAGIREETSPVQIWPHHFDLVMTWLPGDKIAGQDPDSIEKADYADKQMAFGFTLGDDTIAEPYLYVSAYPLPAAFPTLPLPTGTAWHTTGFQAAVTPYRVLTDSRDPTGYLADLWRGLLSAGHTHLPTAT